MKQLGGVVNDVAFVVGGQARFEIGEEVMLFLDVRPRDRTLSVPGLESGKWTLTAAGDRQRAMAREIRGTDPEAVVARGSARRRSSTNSRRWPPPRHGGRRDADASPTDPTSRTGYGAAGFTLLSPAPRRAGTGPIPRSPLIDTQTGGPAVRRQRPRPAAPRCLDVARERLAGLPPGASRGPRSSTTASRTTADHRHLQRSLREITDEQLDAGGRRCLLLVERHPQRQQRQLLEYIKEMIVTDNVASKFASMSTGCYKISSRTRSASDRLRPRLGPAALMYPAITPDCSVRAASVPLSADERRREGALYPATLSPTRRPTPRPGCRGGHRLHGDDHPGPRRQEARRRKATSSSPAARGPLRHATSGCLPDVAGGARVPPGIYYIRWWRGTRARPARRRRPHRDAADGAGRAGQRDGVHRPRRQVLITWRPPAAGGAPTGYRVLAGYSPGATQFQFPVSGTSLAGAGVPAGRYYVRIVAENAVGVSPVSTELELVVMP